jgi:small conductance mechanosensitive channel
MGNILSLTVVISGMVIALGVLNLDKTVTSLLAGAGIIGLAIGLSFQDIITNIIAGIIIAIRKPFSIGDTIETNGYQGEVRDIKLRTTEIDNFNGQVIILPSKDIFQKPLINFSALGKQRVILNAALQPSEDLERAKAVAIEAIRTLPYLMADKSIDFLYKEIAETSVKFMVRYWIVPTKTLDITIALSDGIEALKKAYAQNNIKMPPSIAKVEITDRKTVDK